MNSNSLKAEQKPFWLIKVLLSVCSAVILAHRSTFVVFHRPHPEYRNTEIQKCRNTETQNAVPVLHGALLLLHGPDLGWVWQRCPQHRRGEALRHRHDAPWLWVAPIHTFWLQNWSFGVHLLYGQPTPQLHTHLMFWAGSRIFEVLEFTYYMVNPRTHPVIVTPTGFHCCYSLLLTTTQFNISYATPWKRTILQWYLTKLLT